MINPRERVPRIVIAMLVLTLFIPVPVPPQAYPLLFLLTIHAIAVHFANSPKKL